MTHPKGKPVAQITEASRAALFTREGLSTGGEITPEIDRALRKALISSTTHVTALAKNTDSPSPMGEMDRD